MNYIISQIANWYKQDPKEAIQSIITISMAFLNFAAIIWLGSILRG